MHKLSKNIIEGGIKISIEDDKFTLKDDYKQFSDDISKIYSNMTLFEIDITFDTFKKLITNAIQKKSDDIVYTINKNTDKNISIIFIWKGILDGECTITIPEEKIIWNKDKLYKDIEHIPSLTPILNYINCKFKELQTEKELKVNITNQLIDFHAVTNDIMAKHIKEYDLNSTAYLYSHNTIKTILLFNNIYQKFIMNNTMNYEYAICDEEINCKTLNLHETNTGKYKIIRNLPDPNITLVYAKDKIIINGCIFINPDYYEYKDKKLNLKKLFTTYTICKINHDNVLTSSIQRVLMQWYGYNIEGSTIRVSSGYMEYTLFTKNRYLYLKILNILTMKKENNIYNLYLIHNLDEFTKCATFSQGHQYSTPVPIYINNAYLIKSNECITNSLMYFNLDHVSLN